MVWWWELLSIAPENFATICRKNAGSFQLTRNKQEFFLFIQTTSVENDHFFDESKFLRDQKKMPDWSVNFCRLLTISLKYSLEDKIYNFTQWEKPYETASKVYLLWCTVIQFAVSNRRVNQCCLHVRLHIGCAVVSLGAKESTCAI